MGLDPSLHAALTLLDVPLDGTDPDLPAALAGLALSVRSTVASYLGASVAIRAEDRGVGFTIWEKASSTDPPGDRVAASLAVPVPRTLDTSAEVVLYASAPGAFVDLAADLAVLTRTPLAEILIDQHLTPEHRPPDDDSAVVASPVDQAVGVLLGWGWPPEEARRALAGRAALAGTDRSTVASELLDGLVGADAAWSFEPPRGT